MEELLDKVIEELQIDKSNWVLTKFGDVAIQQKQNVDRDNTSLTRYVKGEHMGSEDLHLRSWGELEDEYLGPAFIRRFDEGDILYGSRRTYLRKVVIAPFSGITSNTTFVIKANEKNIDKALLPFVMMSEGFTEHSIRNSKGSVNPYVNWKDLANYEFLLPPKDQQTQLAKLLWAMDDVIEREIEVLESLKNTYQTTVDNLFSIKLENWGYKTLDKIGIINAESLKGKTNPDYEFSYLDIASIVEPKVIGELKKIRFSESPSRARRIVRNDSIVLSMVRPYQQSFVYVEKADDLIASTGTGVINLNPEVNSKFVFHQFFSKRFIRYCEDRMTGTNYPAITPTDIEQFRIAIPKEDKSTIRNIVNQLDGFDKNCLLVKSKIASSKSLQKSLINQIF
ncbi:restriction endonuclease subunit S [Aestuariibaculum sediminum]|uniref:Restriction endonuclease subunit S n=1 Tax=Aestuariibaculum sediminum TaxID=2770637 RepID=A0A8J6Q270_9FLAO|nr:restriction endonuclease subunit S [Aestuariibaculum sediminum]MBD0831821.1 restriction endonuclease subunit S [Aestuariibaculum sediminum]